MGSKAKEGQIKQA